MSLPNPNKPVTEKRLQEFYHRIKNYLGIPEMPSEDMEEILTPLPSVTSRRMKYSTEEQIVGEWTDGKPIYQKTVINYTLSSIISSNVETVIDFKAYRPFASGETGHVVDDGNNSTNSLLCHVINNNLTIGIVSPANYSAGNPKHVTVWYTKTTD